MVAPTIEAGHLLLAASLRRRRILKAMPWRDWLARHFADYTTAPFAERHVRLWEWFAGMTKGVRPDPRVEVWCRGGGKSSTLELGCAYLGAQPEPSRHFVLYVCETQVQADKHVQSVGVMLEKAGVNRAVNKYAQSKGWTQTTLRTSTGFNIMAFGLDAGMRGIKLDQYRPDVIVFDDIDGRHDTADTTRKKIETITTSILPAESADCAIIVVQNKIAQDSIVSQLCDGRADFLHDRLPATVEPAVRDLAYERVIEDGRPRYRITGGEATWAGQDLATCERQINAWGLGAFLREAQHEVENVEGGLWNRARDIDPWRVGPKDTPARHNMHTIAVAVDPNTEGGDEAGIIVTGVSYEYQGRLHTLPHGYVLADRTVPGGPKKWAEAAVAAYHDFGADLLIAEKNNGGQMVAITIGTIPFAPAVTLVWASRGKRTRAEPVQKVAEDGRIHHVGVFPELEKELCTWVPGDPSPNRLDAYVWGFTRTLLGAGGNMGEAVSAYALELDDI